MYQIARADAVRLPLPDQSVDLVLGSPPYVDCRLYLEGGQNIGISRDCQAWVDWMLQVTTEAVRVSKGLVLWVCAGNTRKWQYRPAPEGLLWEWWKRGGHCWRPAYWGRVGIAGSGSGRWLRSDVEYILCFKAPGVDFWTDPTAIGQPPKWAPGGAMSHRLSDGTRRNQWGGGAKSASQRKANGERQKPGRPSHVMVTKSHTKREPDGTMREQHYTPPAIANPGNLFTGIPVGGGLMGHELAHENEAPFPAELATRLIRIACPEGGIVCDPFSGSGTTAAVCQKWGRHALTFDLRQSQCELSRRRIESDRPSLFDSL